MQLSIIIVNFNVRAFLENALISVQKAMKGIDGEVIVVDNNSDDGSTEMVAEKFPDVTLIVNDQNVGFATANNLGLRQAKGEYILLLNPDTIIQENTLEVMINFFEQNSDVGLAGCKILNSDGTLQLACRRSFPTPWVALTKVSGLSSLFPRTKLFGKYNLEYLNPDETYEVDAVSGSFMFLRKAVLQNVGELDERFFMYGEDLDWCYRIKEAGWKIFYVPSTQIIHYKGQSAHRSDIDEVKLFYEAMRLFAQKHFERGILSDAALRTGIGLRKWAAFFAKISRPLRTTLIDVVLVNLSLLLAEFIWFGELFHFPSYAYPVTMTIPGLTIVLVMYSSGAYTTRKLSISRTTGSVVAGYILLSAATFFFKQYGFSRMVLIISGLISVVALPGWRVFSKAVLNSSGHRRRSLFGRRTVIVGTGSSAQEVLRKLRARVDDGYDVVGFIDNNRKHVGEKIAGVEILGSIDNIGKVVLEEKVSEVIFSTDNLSYSDILSVIGRSRNRAVNYRLIPSSLEVIIGKTHIDELDDIPLVDIEYNIDKPLNRFLKRTFDLILSSGLLISMYPFSSSKVKAPRGLGGQLRKKGILIPKIFTGEMSFVGPPVHSLMWLKNGSSAPAPYLGKPGLTGLVQVNYHDDLTPEEVDKYNLYYAKNQSLILDIEILLKSFFVLIKQ